MFSFHQLTYNDWPGLCNDPGLGMDHSPRPDGDVPLQLTLIANHGPSQDLDIGASGVLGGHFCNKYS